MKKLLFLGSAITSFLTPISAFAVNIQIVRPNNLGFSDLSSFIRNALIIAFTIAALLVLIYLIWGAFEWITSGGDKEAVGKARNRIINALIGLAVLAIAFALISLGGTFVGLSLTNLEIPSPQ